MSRVFVVQRPAYRSQGGEWVEKYDISPALTFGQVVDVLPPGNVANDLRPTVRACRYKLADYTDNDYLLALGDPVAIAAATMVAASINGGLVNMLKWDRRQGCYKAYTIEV